MQRNAAIIFTAFWLCAAGTAASLSAHHSFAAEFEASKPITLKGTLTRMDWTNPHVWIYLDVKKPDGSVEPWACEAGSPNVLFRRGFTKRSLPPGAEIVIDGYRAKDASRRASCRDVTFADGRKMFLGSTGTGAPSEVIPDQDKVPSER